ncbi:hypothetical protein K440DRAFT_402763 [Wilcoxina mikolae CBS 423.85]|nr:hypothetical protein K440DRAFT_402763 [Wilcoxina mikolae CBS 423.85]
MLAVCALARGVLCSMHPRHYNWLYLLKYVYRSFIQCRLGMCDTALTTESISSPLPPRLHGSSLPPSPLFSTKSSCRASPLLALAVVFFVFPFASSTSLQPLRLCFSSALRVVEVNTRA